MAADSKKKKLLAEAEKYVLQGKIRQAIADYLKVIKIDPEDGFILNTVGDLYLRQDNIVEANKFFRRVAEQYANSSFFLKAIAVYKKILNSDPDNYEINSTVASLYIKQGLTLEACAQYLHVIELLEKTGHSRDTLEIYERIIELDPLNIEVQQKLASLHQAKGNPARAQIYWSGTARAQMKIRDFSGALESWRKTLANTPLDMEALRGLVDCCMETGDHASALENLQKSLEIHPEDLDLQELLGQVYLAMGDIDAALTTAQSVFGADESRYENYFAVGKALVDKEAYDQTASCLDPIIPILLSQSVAERAVDHYRLILQRRPRHELTLIKLASIYSAIGDNAGYLEALQELADHYQEESRPIEALEHIEKILHADPGNEKCRQLHQQVFAKAYPGVVYTPPVIQQELTSAPGVGDILPDYKTAGGDNAGETIEEVDLLLNYGLLDRALNLLRKLEAKNPRDKEIHRRMLSIYKANQKNHEAAEQCLLLAYLYRAEENEILAQNFLIEAEQLSPELAVDVDLEEFSRQHGVDGASMSTSDEIDLSSDTMNSLFAGAAGPLEHPMGDELMDDDLPQDIPLETMETENADSSLLDEAPPEELIAPSTTKSLVEQLQEVDFYIRLGFNDEALSKLNEIARVSPDNSELKDRYKQLGQDMPSGSASSAGSETLIVSDESAFLENSLELQMEEAQSKREHNFGLGVLIDEQPGLGTTLEEDEKTAREQVPILETSAPSIMLSPSAPSTPPKMNDMFADLMEEVSMPADQAVSDASFEEHFNMGIAFSEMELMDEALREFDAAIKSIELRRGDPRVIQCCERLSHCFLRKNMPMSAVRWCQTGLNLTEKSSHEAMALRYDMGIAHALAGSNNQAIVCFDQVFSIDPGYRDVAQRIDELKSGLQRHAV